MCLHSKINLKIRVVLLDQLCIVFVKTVYIKSRPKSALNTHVLKKTYRSFLRLPVDCWSDRRTLSSWKTCGNRYHIRRLSLSPGSVSPFLALWISNNFPNTESLVFSRHLSTLKVHKKMLIFCTILYWMYKLADVTRVTARYLERSMFRRFDIPKICIGSTWIGCCQKQCN